MKYKIKINQGNYNDFEIYNAFTLALIERSDKDGDILYSLDPVKLKLFDQDIFSLDTSDTSDTSDICVVNSISLIHSTTRMSPNIPGVLILENNQRYGQCGKNSRGKYLYKCIPDDRRIPEFLVPYKLKIGFSKHQHNKYIVFKFKNWDEKHPRGEITQIIGDVDQLSNFYEYQLYCKSLHSSIQSFNKAAREKLRGKNQDYYIQEIIKKYPIENRIEDEVYTIDSASSKSFDDAFSLRTIKDSEGHVEKYIISIYISNVPLWLDALDLWDSFTKRISTIYLPDKKRPMIPTILSDNLCSLKEGQLSAAFILDVEYCVKTEEIVSHRFSSGTIRVRRNISHQRIKEATSIMDMLNSVGPATTMYKDMLSVCTKINKKYNYIDKIQNSQDLIAYLMILTNYFTAKHLLSRKIGIFRSMTIGHEEKPIDTLPPEINKFIKMWNSSGSNYITFEPKITEKISSESKRFHHEFLNLDAYVHITSPIRRLVDLLNMTIMVHEVTNSSPQANKFYELWTSPEKIDYINRTMKAIRKIQNDCALLDLCVKNKELQKDLYDGYIFNRLVRTDGLFQYLVYLPKIKMVNRFTSSNNLALYTSQTFRLYLFLDEIKFKRKIKLEVIHDNKKEHND